MKIIQVVNALPALQKLADKELPIKKLYKLSKLLGSLDNEIAFYNAQRGKIIAKYCDIIGDKYVPREEDVGKFNSEIDELLNTEIECEINEVYIGDLDNIVLSYNDLVILRGFVRIDGDD
jgi:hypothetical protein